MLSLQITSWGKRKRRIFTRLRHGEENFLHILQGGAGKQQLARDETKMLGDEEIRNTKELELIKSRIKALFFEKLNWFKQDQWWSNNKSHKKADLIWITSENGSRGRGMVRSIKTWRGHFSFGFQMETAKCVNNVKVAWAFTGLQDV